MQGGAERVRNGVPPSTVNAVVYDVMYERMGNSAVGRLSDGSESIIRTNKKNKKSVEGSM